ncbi:hypothetical protein EBR03_10185 [bacterium]|nr:hypothetical protein [bacterium]
MVITLKGATFSAISPESSEFRELLNVATRLADKDSSIWGEAAAREAKIRLNWVELPESSRELLPWHHSQKRQRGTLAARFEKQIEALSAPVLTPL